MFRLSGPGQIRTESEKPADADAAPAVLDTAPPLKPFSSKGTHMPPSKPTQSPFRTELPRRLPDLPGAPRKPDSPEGKKLVVGRDIRLSGAICSCDCLVVEGTVEADLTDTRTLVVAAGGTFTGTAIVASADISGLFEGELTAVEVTVRQGGAVKGKIDYTQMVMERGAMVDGTLAQVSRKAAPVKALIGGDPAETAG